MTQGEFDVLNDLKIFLRKVIRLIDKSDKIDWEKRRYEVAKDLFVHNEEMSATSCVEAATLFINALKRENEKWRINEES